MAGQRHRPRDHLRREDAVPYGEPVTAGHVDTARERLIRERAFHLDSLADKLNEPRVKRFIEPLLAGTGIEGDDAYNDDLQYVRDLGLIARDAPIRVANPVYREVIARSLTESVQEQVTLSPQSFLLPDGAARSPSCAANPRHRKPRAVPGLRA